MSYKVLDVISGGTRQLEERDILAGRKLSNLLGLWLVRRPHVALRESVELVTFIENSSCDNLRSEQVEIIFPRGCEDRDIVGWTIVAAQINGLPGASVYRSGDRAAMLGWKRAR